MTLLCLVIFTSGRCLLTMLGVVFDRQSNRGQNKRNSQPDFSNCLVSVHRHILFTFFYRSGKEVKPTKASILIWIEKKFIIKTILTLPQFAFFKMEIIILPVAITELSLWITHQIIIYLECIFQDLNDTDFIQLCVFSLCGSSLTHFS